MLLAVAIAGMALGLGAPAVGDVDQGRIVLGGDGTTAIPIEFVNLAPGVPVSSVVAVELEQDHPDASIVIVIEDVVDYERRCVDAEEVAGDRSCGEAAGNGELSRQLDIAIEDLGPTTAGQACPTGTGIPLTSGRVHAVENQIVLVAEALSGGQGRCLRLTFEVPDLPENNAMQSDETRFDLRFGTELTTAVLAKRFEAPPVPLALIAPPLREGILPLSGARLIQLLGAGCLAVASGVWLRGRASSRLRRKG